MILASVLASVLWVPLDPQDPSRAGVIQPWESAISCPYLRPGFALVAGFDDNYLMAPMPHALYLECGNKKLRIRDVSRLSGLVRLKSKADALSFVRLRTDDKTWWCFRPRYREIRVVKEPNSKYAVPEGFDGEVWNPVAVKVVSQFPRVTKHLGFYTIERLVVGDDLAKDFTVAAFYLSETITENGQYQARYKPLAKTFSELASIDWYLMYEE